MAQKNLHQVVSIDEVPPKDTEPYRPMVLVVDDESVIADTVSEILNRSGYATMTAYDANEAMEMALLTPPEMLITDVILPGMNGIELAIQIRHIYPDCKILLFSGQAATVDLLSVAHGAGHRFTLVNKPIHPRDLLHRVSTGLNRAVAAPAYS